MGWGDVDASASGVNVDFVDGKVALIADDDVVVDAVAVVADKGTVVAIVVAGSCCCCCCEETWEIGVLCGGGWARKKEAATGIAVVIDDDVVAVVAVVVIANVWGFGALCKVGLKTASDETGFLGYLLKLVLFLNSTNLYLRAISLIFSSRSVLSSA